MDIAGPGLVPRPRASAQHLELALFGASLRTRDLELELFGVLCSAPPAGQNKGRDKGVSLADEGSLAESSR